MTAAVTAHPVSDLPGHWPAELSLTLAPTAGRTRLTHAVHRGPLRVQRVLHPEETPAEVILLHPPGGLVGGDSLDIAIAAKPGAHGLITAPSAAKLYGSDGRTVAVRNRLWVDADATLEWLPPETLVFDSARARMSTTVDLSTTSRFIGWELTALGRPASDAPFVDGTLDQRLSITVDGESLLHERLALVGGGTLATARCGLAGAIVFGTLFAWPAPTAALDAPDLRTDDCQLALTVVDGLLVARARGRQLAPVRAALENLWSRLRPELIGRPARPPRIWSC